MKSFAVLALLASAATSSSLRLWECPLCDGAVRRNLAFAADCPGCRDLGRVSSFTRAFRTRPDPRVRALFTDFTAGLKALTERASETNFDFFYKGEARYAVCDGEEVVVALLHQAVYSIPGTQRAEAWMFDLRGEPLDHLEAVRSTREGGVGWDFVGAEIRLLTGPGDFTLRLEGQPGEVARRFRFAGGKFERVLP